MPRLLLKCLGSGDLDVLRASDIALRTHSPLLMAGNKPVYSSDKDSKADGGFVSRGWGRERCEGL